MTGQVDTMDDYPAVIWLPTYGTDSLFDDWFADPDMASEDDVKYIRADIHAAEIRRLEDIIAQMSGELTDAYQARDVADKERAEMAVENSRVRTRAAYYQEMYHNTSEALRKTGDRLLKAIDGENKTEPIVTSLGLTAMPVHANGKWAWSLAGEEEEE